MKSKAKLPVTLEHATLRALAAKLGHVNQYIDDPNILWLANALHEIGCGRDANEALGVKRGQGQDDKKMHQHMSNEIAIRWIAARMNPSNGDKPPKKAEAIHEAAEHFSIDEENLKRACPNIEKLKELVTFKWDSQRPRLVKPRD